MRKMLEIVGNGFRLALLELKGNKLRTMLSLLGVTFGIFCIIGVLATVSSLEANVQNDISKLGDNTIYIDKWSYGGGDSEYPWWKYMSRPEPSFREMQVLKKDSALVGKIAFVLDTRADVEAGNSVLNQISMYGPSAGFMEIQPFDVQWGRYFSEAELDNGTSSVVLGFSNAEKLFGSTAKAIGKKVRIKNKELLVIGVTRKKGKSMIGGWEFDECVIIPYPAFRQIFVEKYSSPVIMVQGKPGISVESFRGELRGTLRNIRRLGPREEDDFELNAISDFSKQISSFFGSVSLGGWFIGLLSLVVGAFSIANIMFVTVRERTPVIGLKKAIGAKSSIILAEFLLESAFICLLGGLIGILLVYLLTFALTKAFDFPVFLSMKNISIAAGICIGIGILAGIIPASMASRLDPVVAIRSK